MGFAVSIRGAIVALLPLVLIVGCAGHAPTLLPDVPPAAEESAPRREPADAVRVMSFNLRCPVLIDGPNYWGFRKGLLVDTIREFDPDVLGTQECVASQADYLQERLPDYEFFGVGRNDGRRSGEMCAVFFKRDRFRRTDSGHFWLSSTPDVPGSKSWGSWFVRMVSWVKLQQVSTGRTFYVFNTHFDVNGRRARVESAGLLRSKIKAIAGDMPTIVTGDFNDDPGSETYRVMTTGLSSAGGLDSPAFELSDSYRVANSAAKNEGTRHSFRGSRSGPRIDWILTAGAIQTVSARINHHAQGGRYPSDHFPVEAVLRFAPPGAAPTPVARIQ